jgi:ABC-2 type transport system ATP-binding protein
MGSLYFQGMLRLRHIKKYYDKYLALSISSLELDQNIYWTKGPNGSGKSTLLRMVAGLLPFEGTISIDGKNLHHHPVLYRRSVSWADAEPLFPSFMTGREIVDFYRSIRQATHAEADTLIGLLSMQHYINHKISIYSSGMTKKLSLVLAFLGKVRVMVLDEPLITLDSQALEIICGLIRERHRNDGTLFLLSSHMDLDVPGFAPANQLTVSNNTVILG